MTIFTLKGPDLLTAITRLGFVVHPDESTYADQYTVTRDGDPLNTIATFDLCADGAFRFGHVMDLRCMDWHEFHIELQEVCCG